MCFLDVNTLQCRVLKSINLADFIFVLCWIMMLSFIPCQVKHSVALPICADCNWDRNHIQKYLLELIRSWVDRSKFSRNATRLMPSSLLWIAKYIIWQQCVPFVRLWNLCGQNSSDNNGQLRVKLSCSLELFHIKTNINFSVSIVVPCPRLSKAISMGILCTSVLYILENVMPCCQDYVLELNLHRLLDISAPCFFMHLLRIDIHLAFFCSSWSLIRNRLYLRSVLDLRRGQYDWTVISSFRIVKMGKIDASHYKLTITLNGNIDISLCRSYLLVSMTNRLCTCISLCLLDVSACMWIIPSW